MARQHREFQSLLDNAEKLQLYAQLVASQHQASNASLAKVKSSLKNWERETKDGAERIMRAKKERDEAKQEAKVAQLVATTAGDAKARVEDDLTKALNALAAEEEGRRRLEAQIACLEANRTSLFLEFEASKGEVSSLQAQVDKDKKAMEEDYQKTLDLIFADGYGCFLFKHNICGDRTTCLTLLANFLHNFLSTRVAPNPSIRRSRSRSRRSGSRWGC